MVRAERFQGYHGITSCNTKKRYPSKNVSTIEEKISKICVDNIVVVRWRASRRKWGMLKIQYEVQTFPIFEEVLTKVWISKDKKRRFKWNEMEFLIFLPLWRKKKKNRLPEFASWNDHPFGGPLCAHLGSKWIRWARKQSENFLLSEY